MNGTNDTTRPITEILAAVPGVEGAYAETRPTHAGDVIVAWISPATADAAAAFDAAHAAEGLDPGLRPAAVVPVAALPRTPGGDVDSRSLPEPGGIPTGAIDPPATDLERRIAAAAEEATGMRPLGRSDGLFAMGLDSVHAIAMANALREDGVPVSPRMILLSPTIEGVARAAEGERQPPSAPAAPAGGTDYVSGLDDDQLAALLAEEDL